MKRVRQKRVPEADHTTNRHWAKSSYLPAKSQQINWVILESKENAPEKSGGLVHNFLQGSKMRKLLAGNIPPMRKW
jgi:hypothetical protein